MYVSEPGILARLRTLHRALSPGFGDPQRRLDQAQVGVGLRMVAQGALCPRPVLLGEQASGAGEGHELSEKIDMRRSTTVRYASSIVS